MGGKHGRPVLRVIRRIAPHGKALAIHRIEPCVAIPCLIEMNCIHASPKQLLDLRCMITHAIISAVGHDRIHRTVPADLLVHRMRRNLFRNGFRRKFRRRDRSDDPVSVACWAQEDRDAPAEHQSLLNRLVAIAVAEREVIVIDHCRDDRAIRARGAIQNRVTPMRAKDPRGVFFRFPDGSFMVQQ
jgi:hypothetical protein